MAENSTGNSSSDNLEHGCHSGTDRREGVRNHDQVAKSTFRLRVDCKKCRRSGCYGTCFLLSDVQPEQGGYVYFVTAAHLMYCRLCPEVQERWVRVITESHESDELTKHKYLTPKGTDHWRKAPDSWWQQSESMNRFSYDYGIFAVHLQANQLPSTSQQPKAIGMGTAFPTQGSSFLIGYPDEVAHSPTRGKAFTVPTGLDIQPLENTEDTETSSRLVKHNIDASHGQSGSPVYAMDGGSLIGIIGIHVGLSPDNKDDSAGPEEKNWNLAVKLYGESPPLKELKDWAKEHDESLDQQLSDMTAWESEVFTELRPDLVSTLTPGDMRRQCEAKRLITRAQRQLFALHTGRAVQNEELLDALSTGDDESFHTFLKCIRKVEPEASARRLLAKLEPVDKFQQPGSTAEAALASAGASTADPVVIGAPKKKKIHGSRETRLETEFSASVETPPRFKDQGADGAPKAVGGQAKAENPFDTPKFVAELWPLMYFMGQEKLRLGCRAAKLLNSVSDPETLSRILKYEGKEAHADKIVSFLVAGGRETFAKLCDVIVGMNISKESNKLWAEAKDEL